MRGSGQYRFLRYSDSTNSLASSAAILVNDRENFSYSSMISLRNWNTSSIEVPHFDIVFIATYPCILLLHIAL